MSVRDDLLTRLELDGPIDMHISEDEYDWLRGQARALWTHADYWSPSERRIFLAFLRGYTFYRELSENENQFWTTFHADFGLAQTLPTKLQYDALWTALHSHPATAAHSHMSQGDYRTRRQFVRAIDLIWGIHSLSAPQLMRFFDGYYNSYPGQPIDAALMRRLIPDADDAMLRQAAAYDRLFRRLTRIVDYLLDTDPQLARLPPETLTRHLMDHGIEVGSPNPVLFFANTTESGLARIVGLAGHGTRHRYRFTPMHTRVRSAHPYAEAHLAPGYALAGQPVVLQLEDRIGTTRDLIEIRLEDGRRARVLHGAATFTDVSEGNHEGELLISGRPAGRRIEFTVLPELTWILSHRDGPLIEGQWQVGTVTMQDGRFGTFRWQPHWQSGPHGFVPRMQRVTVTLDDDLTIQLDVTAQSYGARIIDPEGPHILDQLHTVDRLSQLLIRPLYPQKVAVPAVRVAWGSSSERTYDATGGRHLQDLLHSPPAPMDELLVEMQYSGAWHRVHAVPVDIPPVLVRISCDANMLEVETRGAGAAEVIVHEQGDFLECTHTHLLQVGVPATLALELPDFWAPRTVTVAFSDMQSAPPMVIQYAPRQNLKGELRELLVQGLGWSPLAPRTSRAT